MDTAGSVDFHSIIPILLYHKIDPRWQFDITNTSPIKFVNQISTIAADGFKVLPMEDALEHEAPSRIVGLTFDDGYESLRTNAAPILSEHGFAGTIFLIANYIGRTNRWDARLAGRKQRHLDYNDVFALLFDGWRIGAHGLTHTAFTLLDDFTAQRELAESKDLLEQRFGQPIISFAFPFGRFRLRHLEMALAVGYRWLCVPHIPAGVEAAMRKSLIVRRAVYVFDSAKMFRHKWTLAALQEWERKLLYLSNRLATGSVFVQYFRSIFT